MIIHVSCSARSPSSSSPQPNSRRRLEEGLLLESGFEGFQRRPREDSDPAIDTQHAWCCGLCPTSTKGLTDCSTECDSQSKSRRRGAKTRHCQHALQQRSGTTAVMILVVVCCSAFLGWEVHSLRREMARMAAVKEETALLLRQAAAAGSGLMAGRQGRQRWGGGRAPPLEDAPSPGGAARDGREGAGADYALSARLNEHRLQLRDLGIARLKDSSSSAAETLLSSSSSASRVELAERDAVGAPPSAYDNRDLVKPSSSAGRGSRSDDDAGGEGTGGVLSRLREARSALKGDSSTVRARWINSMRHPDGDPHAVGARDAKGSVSQQIQDRGEDHQQPQQRGVPVTQEAEDARKNAKAEERRKRKELAAFAKATKAGNSGGRGR